jgi:hypothetical protein
MGYRRRIENGRKVRFWEDLWFRTCSLTIQFWEIYSIINEPGTTVREAWDGQHLRFTFKRTVDNRTLNLWHEVVQIASSIQYSKEEDVIIWQFASSGKYSVQTLYDVVKQVYTPIVWKISVPPRLHIFLWLLANNKVLTRDNFLKRRELNDVSCLFCTEIESVNHLLFGCCVATVLWHNLSIMFGKSVGSDFESVARLWLWCNLKISVDSLEAPHYNNSNCQASTIIACVATDHLRQQTIEATPS